MALDVYFFGYGSLVNRATHRYDDAHRATARGWRRIWRLTPGQAVAHLSVMPDPDCEIEGLIASVPGADWAALDEREAAYQRTEVSDQIRHALPYRPDIALYVVPVEQTISDPNHRILLSYLDVVVQGYLREYGAAGVQRFFETTRGWEIPILDDRAAPGYPRAQRLERAETELVDSMLAQFACHVQPPDRVS